MPNSFSRCATESIHSFFRFRVAINASLNSSSEYFLKSIASIILVVYTFHGAKLQKPFHTAHVFPRKNKDAIEQDLGVDATSLYVRSEGIFASKQRYLTGVNRLWQGSLRELCPTFRVYPKDFTRIPKRPFAYTQNSTASLFVGAGWCRMGAGFLPPSCTQFYLIIRRLQAKVALSAGFFYLYRCIDEYLPLFALQKFVSVALAPAIEQLVHKHGSFLYLENVIRKWISRPPMILH